MSFIIKIIHLLTTGDNGYWIVTCLRSSSLTGAHNNHPLRTEHNLTPLQLFTVSPHVNEPITIDTDVYGIEEDGPTPDILVPETEESKIL